MSIDVFAGVLSWHQLNEWIHMMTFKKRHNAVKLKRTLVNITVLSLLSLSATSALADTDSKDVYDITYFEQFAPQTLYDILQNTPDANAILLELATTSQSRGFGSSGDQILINKQRLSGKENSIDKELKSIQADSVAAIEVIKGNSQEIDVQSKGVVINVVLKEQRNDSILWTLGANKASGHSANATGSVIYETNSDNTSYRLGINHQAYPTIIKRTEYHYTPEGELFYTNQYHENEKTKTTRLSTKITHAFDHDLKLQVNAFYEDYQRDETVNNDINSEPQARQTFYDWSRDKWEIGGDLNYQISSNNSLKFLFISNQLDADELLWQISNKSGAPGQLNYQQPRKYQSTEQIIRTSWRHKLDGSQVIESGIEQAINRRDESLEVNRSQFQSIEQNDIEETRYEFFIHYNYEYNQQLKLQSSLVYESSTMDVATNINVLTTNDSVTSDNSRDFSYLKPWLSVSFDVNERYQTRFNFERTVSQLSLREFVPWYNQFESRLESINPDLKPEVRDKYSVTFQRNWQATTGSLSITPYYHDISDLITEVVLSSGSGNGNIDSAKEYGLTLNSNFGLQHWGYNNTLISASYTWRDSDMTHPFTGENASIERASRDSWNFRINQNEILSGLSASVSLQKKSPYQFHYYSYQGKVSSGVKASAYIDYKISPTLKLRLSGDNLLKGKYRVHKPRHSSGNFANTDFIREEVRDNDFAPEYSLTLTGNF